MDHKSAKTVCNAIGVLVAIILLLMWLFNYTPVFSEILVALLAACVLAVVVITLVWYRCPACGERLPTRAGKIRHCPYCGSNLEETEYPEA